MSAERTATRSRSPRPESPRRDVLGAFGAAMARWRWAVAGSWLVAGALGLVLLPSLLSSLASPPYEVYGSESERASSVMRQAFPQLGAEATLLVLRSERLTVADPAYRAAIEASTDALRRQAGVATVFPLPLPGEPNSAPMWTQAMAPLADLYTDRHNAYAMVNVAGETRERQDRAPAQRAAAAEAASRASGGAVTAHLVGVPFLGHDLQRLELQDLTRAELIAIPLAVLVLLLGFRAPVAALLPIAVAGTGVVVTVGVVALLGSVLTPNGLLLIGVTAVGLGVGTDYALFVVSRYREEVAAGAAPERAIAVATAMSGRTAVYSGLALIVGASCLLVIRWAAYTQFMVGVSLVIAVEVAAALTLTPAALAILDKRLEWRPWGRRPTGRTAAEGGWARWSRHLMRRPWPYLLGVTAGLLLLAMPATGLKLGIDMERAALGATSTGAGVELLDREPVRGLSGLTVVLVERPFAAPAPNLEPLLAGLRADPLVAVVTAVDNGKDTSAVFVVPRVAADSPRLVELVHRIRGDIGPLTAPPGTTVLAGGPGPIIVDLIDECVTKMWWVIGGALVLLFGLLVLVFRSLLLPLKAVAMSVLVTAAAFGLLVLVFQHGLGAGLLGFTSPGLIWVHVPLVVFSVVFAVALDYEIFLVRRIQEEYRASGDNTGAVAAGLQRTARPITMAAMIMVAAFGGLLVARIVGVKEVGLAIAAAIALEATVVRLALVPALMKILGRWNWWLPFTSEPPAARVPDPREPGASPAARAVSRSHR